MAWAGVWKSSGPGGVFSLMGTLSTSWVEEEEQGRVKVNNIVFISFIATK